jgi:hypothetical protein
MILKIVPKSTHDPEIVPKTGFDMSLLYTGKNWPMREKESRNRNSDDLSRTILRTSKYFQILKQKLNFYFFL